MAVHVGQFIVGAIRKAFHIAYRLSKRGFTAPRQCLESLIFATIIRGVDELSDSTVDLWK